MAESSSGRYPPDVECQMRAFYESLSEKDRRRYAALQARALGHGGIAYVAEVLGCSRHTIERGMKELDQLPDDPAEGRVRRPGGGRKPRIEEDPDLKDNFDQVLRVRTAGDPMRPGVEWTDLSVSEIAAELERLGTPASPPVIRDMLQDRGLGKRKIEKTLAGGQTPDRNAQFEQIAELEEQFFRDGNPVFSMDTKKKEHLGLLYREGRVWGTGAQRAFDHDFPSWAEGVIIPHGIYDLMLNHGHLNLGLSHDTSEFACDSFRWFWQRRGRRLYPDADIILLECDSGGSNNCRHWLFKADLQRLVDAIGIPIRVAHYPTYCSKYNPADRRFFPHVTRACQGVLFDTLDTVVSLMKNTRTSTGLTTSVHVIRRLYETGRKVIEPIKQSLDIIYASLLPQWNYTVVPH